MILPEHHRFDISYITPGDDWRIALPIAGATWETGDTARCHWRFTARSTDIALNLSTAAGTIELNPNELVFVVPASMTVTLAPASYVWDVELTRAGLIETIIEGTAALRQDITRGGTTALVAPSLDFSQAENSQYIGLI